jgi:ankyrin repeat protein
MVHILLEAGADADSTDYDGKTALQIAADRRSIELVQILLEAGADVNARAPAPSTELEGTALQVAVSRGNMELVQVLLDAGADVNAPAADTSRERTDFKRQQNKAISSWFGFC